MAWKAAIRDTSGYEAIHSAATQLLGHLILGAWLAAHVLAPLGIDAASIVGQILIAFIGAAILLAILRLVSRSGWGSGRYAPR